MEPTSDGPPAHVDTPTQPGRPTRRQRLAEAGRRRDDRPRPPETDDLPDLRKARTLWQQKRFPEALDLFERTLRKHPRNLLALTDTAPRVCGVTRFRKAEAILQRLLDLAPDDPAVQLLAGQSFRMIYRPDRAIASFERRFPLQPDLLDARLELAMLLERRGKLEAAHRLLDGMSGRPGCPPEVLVVEGRLARCLREAGLAKDLLPVVADRNAFWATRLHAGMELCVYDSEGDPDAAIDVARRAKDVARPPAGEAVSDQDLWVRDKWLEASGQTTASHLARWAEELKEAPSRRVALLTGPPRSGTTLLENILDAHPGLVSSDERDAFPRYITGTLLMDGRGDEPLLGILDRQDPHALIEQRGRYLGFVESALGEPIGDRLHLDKNPSISTLIPGVLRLFPECRVIMAIRDPRDVVLSCYLTHMPPNAQSLPYLDLATAAEHYAKTMDAWITLRGRLRPDQYLEVRYEDVVDGIEGQARRVLEFLGLPWDRGVLAFHEHAAAKQVDSPSYEQVARPIYASSVARWRRYEKHIAPVAAALQPYIEAFGYAEA